MIEVINNHNQPLVLSDGTILAAAGTKGSVREMKSISDEDRERHANRILIREKSKPQATVQTETEKTKKEKS